MRTITVLRVAIPLVGIGIAAAVVFGRDRGPRVTIPAGTTLVAALEEGVSTQRSEAGDEVELVTVATVRLADGTEIPEGSVIDGVVTNARNGRRNSGPPELGLRFTELEIDGSDHEITTEQFRFGTLTVLSTSDEIALPAGQQFSIRLIRPVTIAYRPVGTVHLTE